MPRVKKNRQAPAEEGATAPGGAAATAAATPQPAPAPVVADPSMSMVLRTKSTVEMRKFTPPASGSKPESTVVAAVAKPITGGDFSECEIEFSKDGLLFACSNAAVVYVVRCADGVPVATIEEPNVTGLQFSNRGHVLVTFRMQDAKRPTEGNMAFWGLEGIATTVGGGTPKEILRCGQSTWPGTWWACDDSHFLRRAQGHLLHLHDGTFASTQPLAMQDLELPRGKEPVVAPSPGDLPFVAVFVPQVKQRMGNCKLYRLPNLGDELLARNFGNADDAELHWSPVTSAVLVLSRGDSDRSGGSYYGKSTLCVMNLKDRETYSVVVGKDDGIHGCAWSSTASEFVVVHGVMPRNKATLYNAQAQPIYSFGEAPRNFVRWAPNGRFFFLSGNGNLAGETQFYDREAVSKTNSQGGDGRLGFFSEKTSLTVWAPDSRTVVSANIFSRLRLDNRFTLWSHSGAKLHTEKFDELYTVAFVPTPATAFRKRAPSPTVQSQAASKPAAYRPPGGGGAAAAMLSRPAGATIGSAAAKPPGGAGPVGAVLAAPPGKKGGRKR